jgi:hypothetical protein
MSIFFSTVAKSWSLVAREALRWEAGDAGKQSEEKRQRDFIAQKACDVAAVLSAQADHSAGAE